MDTSNKTGVWRMLGVSGEREVYMGIQNNTWGYVAINGYRYAEGCSWDTDDTGTRDITTLSLS
jgi:hypothetical protein